MALLHPLQENQYVVVQYVCQILVIQYVCQILMRLDLGQRADVRKGIGFLGGLGLRV